MIIQKITHRDLIKGIEYLREHEETSMFLLQNLNEHGSSRGFHQNSGNFYLITQAEQIKGIFCLANRGNILFQLDNKIDEILVIKHLRKFENVKIRGVLGENTKAKKFWNIIQQYDPTLNETFSSKEILYSLDLTLKTYSDIENSEIFLMDKLNIYLKFIKSFYEDQNLPDNSSTEQRTDRFKKLVSEKCIWQYSLNNEIVSMAALNARFKNIAQVGGVYTPRSHRSKGYSKKCLNKLIYDCKHKHGITKIILFTGENNIPAQKVYESIGFVRVGHYGMYFGN